MSNEVAEEVIGQIDTGRWFGNWQLKRKDSGYISNEKGLNSDGSCLLYIQSSRINTSTNQ